ncbi:leucine-rich repeat-containing protein 52 [Sinocyclocheilus rhinocerous]|uniref:leucine-rich repeat-containing protein 52 n=1 Tax=Sinocyclocheilus rhinocerous TaxID=307959 RepID=UPI0007B90098|nr:PREDICTED: leucine-rich repeat-containing protein 52-like [Sinocyclocheilus rhinocerous]
MKLVATACVLLVLLVHVVSSIPPGCPERCVCDDQHVVQCAEQDLRRFPTGLPLTTRQLILSNNRISELPAFELNYLSDLTYLDCSNNSLAHISPSTFGNLRKLAYLDLSFNSFCKIEEQTFSALESLVMLRLTDNRRLSEFHPQAFSHASALQVLDISRNNLSRLNVSSLVALAGLRALGLSGNPWLCACDAEELCLWMHTDTFKFQEEGQTVCEGPSYLQGQRLSELGLWLRRQCHPGLARQDYLFFVAIGFVIFGVGTVLAWAAGMVIVLCQRCVKWRKDRPNAVVPEEEFKPGQSG